MSAKSKIVFATVNFGCLVYTLFAPSKITFFAIVPTIVSGMSWLFVAQEGASIRRPEQYAYVLLYAFSATICILLGLFTDVTSISVGHYTLKGKDDIAIFAGKSFEYWPVAISILISVSILVFAEAWNDVKNSLSPQYIDEPLATKIKEEVKYIN